MPATSPPTIAPATSTAPTETHQRMAALPSFHEHGDTQSAPRKAETCNCYYVRRIEAADVSARLFAVVQERSQRPPPSVMKIVAGRIPSGQLANARAYRHCVFAVPP